MFEPFNLTRLGPILDLNCVKNDKAGSYVSQPDTRGNI